MSHITKTGVIGSGSISSQYLRNMTGFFNNLEVIAIASAHLENAQKRGAEFGVPACTVEELLANPEIELVVILTPAPTHAELIERSLKAGKHVYTEKTMTLDPKDAERLLALADEKGLYLCSAPDTFLGAALQSARQAIDAGKIGEPVSFSMNLNRNIDVLASLFSFLRLPGGGLAYDYGVYYLTAIVSLLGPVDSVYAKVLNRSVQRTNMIPQSPDFGKTFEYNNESQIYGVLTLENGVTGTISMNGDTCMQDLAYFYLYGTQGVLKLTCANDFGGTVEYIPSGFDPSQTVPQPLESDSPLVRDNRGIGPAEMADAIEQKRPARTDAHMAYHVLDVIDAMMKSSDSNGPVAVSSTCARPEAFTDVTRLCK